MTDAESGPTSRTRLLLGGAVGAAAAVAGCLGGGSDDGSGDADGGGESDDGETGDESTTDGGSSDGTGTSQSTTTSTGIDAFGEPSFDGESLFVPLKEDASLDLVVLVDPFGRQFGTAEPTQSETATEFTLFDDGEMYEPGTYTVRGYREPDETTDDGPAYEEVATRTYSLEPEVALTSVTAADEPGTVNVVIENTGSGPYRAVQFRHWDPGRTPSKDQWSSYGVDPVTVPPGESIEFGPIDTGFQGEKEDETSREEAEQDLCTGSDSIERVFEVRTGSTNEYRLEKQFTLLLDGDVHWEDGGMMSSGNEYTCTRLHSEE